ncbi:hypothetical protein QJS04_geneDACA016168 [Acorus gramineus]|uniref:Uncharacterized protein n=1 Tax=Acorus gramineus TaxID=55184 RepID=A0AAV9AN43_ACOGR|nr:hypothetical protein QJS04_geneDACA016168 [Acorus gramineus]
MEVPPELEGEKVDEVEAKSAYGSSKITMVTNAGGVDHMCVQHNMARELGVPHLGEPIMEHRWVAVLSFGEGWHNNHHAFEYSASHGLKWWQIDMTWYTVWLLRAMGLATDNKRPKPGLNFYKSKCDYTSIADCRE